MLRRASPIPMADSRRPIPDIVTLVADVDNMDWAATYIGESRYAGRFRRDFPSVETWRWQRWRKRLPIMIVTASMSRGTESGWRRPKD